MVHKDTLVQHSEPVTTHLMWQRILGLWFYRVWDEQVTQGAPHLVTRSLEAKDHHGWRAAKMERQKEAQ